MPDPRNPRDSTRARRITFQTHRQFDAIGHAYMICHCGRGLRPSCGQKIDPVRDRWRAHHNVPWAEGGEDTPDNLFPILELCDVEATAPEDAARIAKNKRIQDKRSGVLKSKHPMPGSRNHPSGLRKRMSGKVDRW